MPCYSPTQIAQEVKNQGGSNAQGWIAAAMVGCESNGCTDEPAGGGCAQNGGGIFQFLPSTWRGYGLPGNPCDGTLSQQVTAFLKASSGGSYHDWNVDFYPPGTANVWSKPYPGSPQPGSCFAKQIAQLSAQGLGKLLGNVPTNWADAGAVSPGLQAGTGQTQQDPCTGGFGFTIPLTFGAGKVCLFTRYQLKAITSALGIVAGSAVFMFGVVMLAAYEYDNSGAKQAVNSTAKKVGIGASLLAGQPEAAGAIAATGGGKAKGKKTRTVGLGPGAKGRASDMSQRESRRIEDQFKDLQEDQGVTERGRNPTAERIAREQRASTRRSVNGSARPRRQPETREAQRARRAREGFQPSAGDA